MIGAAPCVTLLTAAASLIADAPRGAVSRGADADGGPARLHRADAGGGHALAADGRPGGKGAGRHRAGNSSHRWVYSFWWFLIYASCCSLV
jgi:hypothetical protein